MPEPGLPKCSPASWVCVCVNRQANDTGSSVGWAQKRRSREQQFSIDEKSEALTEYRLLLESRLAESFVSYCQQTMYRPHSYPVILL